MTDQPPLVMAIVGILALVLLLGVRMKRHRARRAHSLGEMYRPAPKPPQPPPDDPA